MSPLLNRRSRLVVSACALTLALTLAGCGDGDSGETAGASGAAGTSNAVAAKANVIAGRVTMGDGSPLRGEVKDVQLNIYGVSEAGERVSYSPALKPDGTYSQKVAGGQYAFNPSRIVVIFNGTTEFARPLEPVGPNWNKNRDAADGIVQDFVWKPTGPTPYGQSSGLDKHNATHWYGMSIGMGWQSYRSDKNASTTPPPEGTTLVFTIKPTSKAIDGTQPETKTIEMPWNPKQTYPNDDIADLMPANYEITGVAKLPDGTTKPILFQGKGDYPNFVPTLKAPLESDGLIGGYFKQLAGFVIE